MNTSITNLLNANAPVKSPCISLDIALVNPHAGHSQFANNPVVGQFPL